MKKLLVTMLALSLVLTLGIMSFADIGAEEFRRGINREYSMSKNFERGNGMRKSITEDEFETYRAENRANLSLNLKESTEIIEILADLTGDSIETIQASGLTLHEYSESKNVLDVFQKEILELKEVKLNELVTSGKITEEKADFMLEKMSQMNGIQTQQRLNKGNGRGFNNKMNFQNCQ